MLKNITTITDMTDITTGTTDQDTAPESSDDLITASLDIDLLASLNRQMTAHYSALDLEVYDLLSIQRKGPQDKLLDSVLYNHDNSYLGLKDPKQWNTIGSGLDSYELGVLLKRHRLVQTYAVKLPKAQQFELGEGVYPQLVFSLSSVIWVSGVTKKSWSRLAKGKAHIKHASAICKYVVGADSFVVVGSRPPLFSSQDVGDGDGLDY